MSLKKKNVTYFKILSSILISGFLFWLLAVKVGFGNITRSFSELDKWSMFPAFGFYFLSYVLLVFRWKFILPDGANPFLTVFRITSVHNFLNNILPARTGEVWFPILMQKYLKVQKIQAAGLLIGVRIFELVLLISLFLISIRVSNIQSVITLNVKTDFLKIMLLAVPFVLMVFLFFSFLGHRRIAENKKNGFWSKISESLRPVSGPSNFFKLFFITAAIFLSRFGMFYFLMKGAGTRLDIFDSFCAVVVALGAGLFPVQGMAGFGAFEGGWVLGLRPFGVGLSEALALGFTFHVVQLAFSSIFGGYGFFTLRSTNNSVVGEMSWMDRMRKFDKKSALLGLILISAFILRFWGIWFGLPYIYHPDESHEVLRALRLGSGGIDLDFNRTMKGGYYLILFFEYCILFLICYLTGKIHNPHEFGLFFTGNPTIFWLLGRMTTVLLGTLTVYLIYRLGTKLFDRSKALLAAGFLALSYHHILESHYITVDVPLTCVIILCFLSFYAMKRENSLKWYLVSGLLVSFAIQTKITASALIFPFLWVHFTSGTASIFSKIRSAKLIASLVIIAVFYMAGNPGIIFNFRIILSYLAGSFSGNNSPRAFDIATAHFDFFGWKYYLRALITNSGYPGAILFVGGILYALIVKKWEHILLLLFIIPYGIVIIFSKTVAAPRYLLPLIPLAGLFASAFVFESIQWISKIWNKFIKIRHPLPGTINMTQIFCVIFAILILFESTLINSLSIDMYYSKNDTRSSALEWMMNNIPDGARIMIDGHITFPSSGTVPIPVSSGYLKKAVEYYRKEDPGKAEFLTKYKIPAIKGKTFEPVYIDLSAEQTDLSKLLATHTDYIVLSSNIYRKFSSGIGCMRFPEIAEFYKKIRTDRVFYELVKVYDPFENNMQGPTIEIYRNHLL